MIIQREEYLNKLIAFKDKQLIKVVSGIRRCGKSTLLELYQRWLCEQGVADEQIIAINFEDIDYEELTDEVTTGLCVRFVTHMREVIKEVFEA